MSARMRENIRTDHRFPQARLPVIMEVAAAGVFELRGARRIGDVDVVDVVQACGRG
jgi:hypothetical protein